MRKNIMADLRSSLNPVFRFIVEVGDDKQGVFTECTLPTIEWEMQEIKEGGLNSYTHQLPGRRKGVRITLKNGVGKASLLDWYIKCMGFPPYERRKVTVKLCDSKNQPVMTWNIQNAYPTKWTGPNLKADENSIAIQTLELACGEITINQ
jgi:phage tail-like protein